MRKMPGALRDYLAESSVLLTAAAGAVPQPAADAAVDAVVRALSAGKPLLVCGNGGSACDAMHITGELVARFLEERRALKAICLSSNSAVMTAWSNDHGFATAIARQVEAYGEPDAVLLGISTSGNSENIVAAFERAREMGMFTIALTGEGGGRLAALADCLLAVPSRRTPLIQQVHVCIYHYLCQQIEQRMMEKDAPPIPLAAPPP
jgi:D-sedoheptulose 7-phosphate isomerase